MTVKVVLHFNRILERSKYSKNNQPNISTVGIVVSDWTYYKKVKQSQTALKSITFMTWDFGGQEEYYATHQCFLSRRSLYLVVWNVSHGLKGAEEIKPWLLNIQVIPFFVCKTACSSSSIHASGRGSLNCKDISRLYHGILGILFLHNGCLYTLH